MKVRVVKDFTHKGTQRRSYTGEILDVSEERAAELIAKGVAVEVEKVVVEAGKEKPTPKHTPKKKK